MREIKGKLYLDITEAAETIGVSPAYARRMGLGGAIAGCLRERPSRKIWLPEDSVKAFSASREPGFDPIIPGEPQDEKEEDI